MHAHPNTEILTKKAIDAALKKNWTDCIEINTQILDKTPNDANAKLRLARAYMFSKQPTKATKLFKEVLKADPINTVAIKHLEMLKANKVVTTKVTDHAIDQNSLILEPGTTQDIVVTITARGTKAETIEPGQKLKYKLLKTRLDIIWNEKVLATVVDKSLLSKLNTLLENDEEKLWISFKGGQDKEASVMLKASKPIFKSQRQEVRPYVKKGAFGDEPELELPEDPE